MGEVNPNIVFTEGELQTSKIMSQISMPLWELFLEI